MEISQETREKIQEAYGDLIEAVKKAIQEIVSRVWDFMKERLPVFEKFIQEYKENEQRHQENMHNRSSWIINRDTRKSSQVMSNKPRFMVRKIIG